MKLFNSFLVEAEIETDKVIDAPRVNDDIITVFGRHNPPHLGHQKTFDMAEKQANNIGADQRFYTSRTQDPKKNPLPYEMKVNFLQKMFPKHADKWDTDENVRTVLDTATKAHGQGYKNFHFIGGGDRQQSMEDLLRRYNDDLYKFDNIYSHSAGERTEVDPQDIVANLSASKMRNFAMNDDFDNFKQGLPNTKGFDPKEVFEALQMFMQKNEDFDLRDMYATDQIFLVGEMVESQTSGLVGRIHRRGANHLICVTENGIMFKNFIHEVELV